MSFSPSQAALEGFRLVGRRPFSFLLWAIILGVAMAGLLYGLAWTTGGLAPHLDVQTFDYDALVPLMGRFALVWLAGMVVMMLVGAMLNAAIYRAVLAPGRRGLGYLRLGGAEVRLVALQIFVVMVVVLCELATGGIIVGVAISGLPLAAKILIGVAAGVADLAWTVILLVRLSLAGPRIVARGSIDLGGAWSMTRGRFWALFVTGVLAFALAMAVSMFAQMCVRPFMLAASGPLANLSMGGEGLRPFFAWSYMLANPALYVVLGALAIPALALQMVVQAAPFAAVYRDISERG